MRRKQRERGEDRFSLGAGRHESKDQVLHGSLCNSDAALRHCHMPCKTGPVGGVRKPAQPVREYACVCVPSPCKSAGRVSTSRPNTAAARDAFSPQHDTGYFVTYCLTIDSWGVRQILGEEGVYDIPVLVRFPPHGPPELYSRSGTRRASIWCCGLKNSATEQTEHREGVWRRFRCFWGCWSPLHWFGCRAVGHRP